MRLPSQSRPRLCKREHVGETWRAVRRQNGQFWQVGWHAEVQQKVKNKLEIKVKLPTIGKKLSTSMRTRDNATGMAAYPRSVSS